MSTISTGQQISIRLRDHVHLEGELVIPEGALGLVLMTQGSASSRLKPKKRFIATELNRAGLATLLFNPLTSHEESEHTLTRMIRFNTMMLGQRLLEVTDWLVHEPETHHLKTGYFGDGACAAAALFAAAARPADTFAVVCGSGRPDLADTTLDHVTTPTLLIVGGRDEPLLDLNRQAMKRIATPDKALKIIPEAGHVFEEPGKLQAMATLAGAWFTRHLNAFVQLT